MRAAFVLFAIFALAGLPLGTGETFGAHGYAAADSTRDTAYPGDLPPRFATPGGLPQVEVENRQALVSDPLSDGKSAPAVPAAAPYLGLVQPAEAAHGAPLDRVASGAATAGFRSRAPPPSA